MRHNECKEVSKRLSCMILNFATTREFRMRLNYQIWLGCFLLLFSVKSISQSDNQWLDTHDSLVLGEWSPDLSWLDHKISYQVRFNPEDSAEIQIRPEGRMFFPKLAGGEFPRVASKACSLLLSSRHAGNISYSADQSNSNATGERIRQATATCDISTKKADKRKLRLLKEISENDDEEWRFGSFFEIYNRTKKSSNPPIIWFSESKEEKNEMTLKFGSGSNFEPEYKNQLLKVADQKCRQIKKTRLNEGLTEQDFNGISKGSKIIITCLTKEELVQKQKQEKERKLAAKRLQVIEELA